MRGLCKQQNKDKTSQRVESYPFTLKAWVNRFPRPLVIHQGGSYMNPREASFKRVGTTYREGTIPSFHKMAQKEPGVHPLSQFTPGGQKPQKKDGLSKNWGSYIMESL